MQYPHLNRKNPLGQYQRIFSLFVMLFFYQLPFIASVIMLAYSLIVFDYTIWIAFALICLVQYPIKKCKPYIEFVNNYINPLLYFNKFQRIFEQKIPEDQPCMFSFHPHGVFAYGLLANMNYYKEDPLSRMVGLGSRFILNMPVTGLLLRLWGVQSVNPTNLKRLMTEKQNVGLLPGGFEQATLTTKTQMRIYIQNRKGFIKYALKYNYTIYPTLVLNQHQAFWTFDYFLKIRMLMNKLKLPGVLFFHPKTLFFYPPQVDFITIVGRGLRGQRTYQENQEPTSQQIEAFHKKYINEIKRIYEKHKHKNGNGDIPLVMY